MSMRAKFVAGCAALVLAACAPPERNPPEEAGTGGAGGTPRATWDGGHDAGKLGLDGAGAGQGGAGGMSAPAPQPGTGGMPAAPPPPNKTPAIVASKEADEMRGVGLDARALPPFAVSDKQAHFFVMQSFARNLGGGCEGCHVLSDLPLLTPNKHVARHMWDDILGKLVMKDGSPLYCDSCHQGKAKFLDRSNKDSLMVWMQANMVDKLARRDGARHDCTTCHGQPAAYDLIARWKVN
jgi:hypothetical protein